jgi:hypothetical protein
MKARLEMNVSRVVIPTQPDKKDNENFLRRNPAFFSRIAPSLGGGIDLGYRFGSS